MPARTVVLAVDSCAPQSEPIARAAAVLRAGGLVAFPTETVYGLGANALDALAVEGIFRAKGRPSNNPLIVHVPHIADAMALAADWTATAAALAERFWPGPLSLVVRKQASVPDVTTAGATTVALRIPAHPVALALLQAAQVPIAAPSANRSMAVSPTLAQHVLRGLDGRIDLLLDAGATSGGLESTVLDLTTTPPRLLRPGLVSRGEIEAIVGPIAVGAHSPASDESPHPSPGLFPRHYAPTAPLECVPGSGQQRVGELLSRGYHVGWLTIAPEDTAEPPAPSRLIKFAMPSQPAGYAALLYAVLHACDAAGVDRIVVDLPPDNAFWAAIHDRLRRASTPI